MGKPRKFIHTFIFLLFILISCLFETAAFKYLFLKNYTNSLLTFYIFHLLASLAIAAAFYIILPEKYKRSKTTPILFFTAISIALPILGALFLSVLTLVLLRKQIKPKESRIEMLSFDETIREGAMFQGRTFGEAHIANLLRTETLPQESRLKALTTISNLNIPSVFTLIKERLSDTHDEIRLFAFSVIDKMEKNISRQINVALNGLKEAKETEIPLIYKDLAMLYWETGYLNIGDERHQNFTSGEASKYAKLAYEKLTGDTSLLILMGRISLRKGELQSAKDYFFKSLESGTQKEKIVPYLAEIFYRERNFNKVKQLLTENPSLRFNFLMYPVMSLWVEENG